MPERRKSPELSVGLGLAAVLGSAMTPPRMDPAQPKPKPKPSKDKRAKVKAARKQRRRMRK